MAMLQNLKLEIYADYLQFYLWAADSEFAAPEDYVDKDLRNRVKIGSPGFVAIMPARRARVPVEFEVHDCDSSYQAENWDHITECSLKVTKGRLQVYECCGYAISELAIPAGWYRIRAFHRGLDSVQNDWEGKDFYRVVIWPERRAPLKIVKQWTAAR
jgi:hypothetical protein